MPLLNNEIARRENGRLELRTGPARVRWNLDDLVTADGHRLHCAFTASVVALPQPAERRMLEEVFLSRQAAVTFESLVAHFTPGLRAAASKTAGEHKAAEWIKSDLKQPMIEALRQAGSAIAFSAGIDLLPPFTVEFDSPTFASQQIEELDRTLAERRVAGQVEHFERASKLLKQFQELKAAAPDLAPADVLKQISPADQGLMLQTLLLAAGKSTATQSLWAVAGTGLAKIDPRSTPAVIQHVAVPQDLGPLRSVQAARLDGSDILLIGAKQGVIAFNPANNASQQYVDASINSQLGFSRAVVWNGLLVGCHGDAGIVAWTLNQFASPQWTIRPAELRAADNPPPVPTSPPPAGTQSISTRTAGIRNLTVLDDGHIVFSVGHYLVMIDSAGLRSQMALETTSEVVGIFVDGQRAVVVQDDGLITQYDRKTLTPLSRQRKTGRLCSASMLPWLGAQRLLLATDEGPVYCVGLDDEVVTTYLSNHHGLRVISAATDLIAAVSQDRQRVVFWQSWDGKKPVAELNVTATLRHRVGDLEFA